MQARTFLRTVGLVLCLTGRIPTTALSTQPSDQGIVPGLGPAHLIQSEVLRLAKTAVQKMGRQKIYDYHVTSVIFDLHAREWTVLFEPQPPQSMSRGCLYVYVKDDTKDASIQPCR